MLTRLSVLREVEVNPPGFPIRPVPLNGEVCVGTKQHSVPNAAKRSVSMRWWVNDQWSSAGMKIAEG